MRSNRSGKIAVVGCCLATFWPGALNYAYPGVMAPYWQQAFHAGKGAIGNCVFFSLPMVGIFMFVAGKLQEKYGTRRVLSLGTGLTSLALLLPAFATSIHGIYLWAAVNGMAGCLVYLPAVTSVQRWYPERKGLISGLVSLSFGGAAAAMAPVFGRFLDWAGYVPLNLMTAAVTLLFGLLGAQWAADPQSVCAGQHRDEPAHLVRTQSGPSLTLGEAVQTRSFWFLWGAWALQGATGISMISTLVLFGIARGFSFAEAVLILTCFNLTSGMSRLISGCISDRVGRTPLMRATFFSAAGACLAINAVHSLAALCGLAMVVGFSFGTLFAVSAPLAADCFGFKHFGAILGLVFTAYGFVAGIIGPSLAGYMLDRTADFGLVFRYLAVFSFVSAVLFKFVSSTAQRPVALRSAA
jgi:OFA family oxalate/formate antiporter-like MFS transporter